MSSSFAATGGLELGGQGEWLSERIPTCRLVLTRDGLRNCLGILTARWENRWKVGLFQSDSVPRLSMTMADLVPCDFSGYIGEQLTFSWQTPSMQGVMAVSTAHDLTWKHDGGAVGNFVYGYYVVDDLGTLVWAERFCPDPLSVGKRGLIVRVRPFFFLINV